MTTVSKSGPTLGNVLTPIPKTRPSGSFASLAERNSARTGGYRIIGRRLSEPSSKAHKLVRQLFLLMELKQMSRAEVARRAGVSYGAMKDWWTGLTVPDMVLLDSALQVLGYRLEITENE